MRIFIANLLLRTQTALLTASHLIRLQCWCENIGVDRYLVATFRTADRLLRYIPSNINVSPVTVTMICQSLTV